MLSLTIPQREILEALVTLYNKKKRMIRSKELADYLNKDESSIKSVVSALKALGFVESKSGPEGGYIPTAKGREFLKKPTTIGYEVIQLKINGKPSDISIVEIDFLDLTSVVESKAILRLIGNIYKLKAGDKVKFGPTPSTRLIVEGEVIEKDDLRKEIIIRITTMTSIPREIAKNIMSKNLISFSPNDSLRYVADVLYSRNIRGGPVIEDGKIVGLITTSEIAKALKEGSLDAKVSDYIRKDVHVVNENEDILNVIKKMVSLNVGRLIVIDSEGKTIGIVTRTDILKRIAGLIEL
ncbi:MAG: CBS domain-containing protein [Candidatus Odinarchaeota archaeon]|nr:CBS domain-containing protein [Candidatus Odinarchaeota archaeon]